MAWVLNYWYKAKLFHFKLRIMKKIALFMLAAILSLSSFAMYDNTRLVVSTTSSQNYYLFVDGYAVGDQYKNGNSFYISDINSANHRIQLYKQSNSIFGGNNRKLVYDNTIFLKSNTETTLSLNVLGNVVINEQPLGNSGNNNGGGWNGSGNNTNTNNDGWNGSNNGTSNNNKHKGHNCEGKKGKGHKKNKHHNCDNDNSWNNNGNGNNNNGNWNNGNSGCNNKVAMNDKSFYQLKQSIQNENFDYTKQSIATQAIRNNNFTTTQVKELVQLFSFESSKLAIAKLAYKNTIDKQNYFVVNDIFSFSSSKQELMQYTQSIG